MSLDTDTLDRLQGALDLWHHATRAWERRNATDLLRAVATPDVVDALVGEYVAAAPTNAELDGIALQLRGLAQRLEDFGTRTPVTAGLVAVISITGTIGRNERMAFMLQSGQQVELTASYQDRHGNPAEVESQTWSSSDETVLTVTDNGDGTATAAAAGSLGTAQIQLSADARFGDEVNTITGILDVEVVASEAVTAVITPGEPTDSGTA